MTVQPTRDQLRALAGTVLDEDRYLGDEEEVAIAQGVRHLLAQLDRAEHRIARLEAQTSIRGRAVIMYRERAREAEAERDEWREASAKLAASSNQANADLYEAEARMAEEKRLRMEATAAATKAEARIEAVRDVLDGLEQQPADQIGWDAAGLLPIFRRALNN